MHNSPTPITEADGEAIFTDYFVKNYPGPSTVIGNPHWHAPKIWRAALTAMQSAAPSIQEDVVRDLAAWLYDFAEDDDCSLSAYAPDAAIRKEYEGYARQLLAALPQHGGQDTGDAA